MNPLILVMTTVLLLQACQVENVTSCQLAENALLELELECYGEERSDFSCNSYADYPGDCSDYFDRLKENLRCENGEVYINNTGKCINL